MRAVVAALSVIALVATAGCVGVFVGEEIAGGDGAADGDGMADGQPTVTEPENGRQGGDGTQDGDGTRGGDGTRDGDATQVGDGTSPGDGISVGRDCATRRETTIRAGENGSMTATGDRLPVDAARIYERTAALHDVDEPPELRIEVRCPANLTAPAEVPPFLTRLGIDFEGRSIGYLSFTEGRTVRVSDNALDGDSLEYVLAHEFTHVLQHGPANFSDRVDAGLDADRPGGADETLLRQALVEGSAIYVGDAYWRRYVGTTPTPTTDVIRQFENATRPTVLYRNAPDRYGYRYLGDRNVSVANLSTTYADPPRTTEELLDGLAPGTEPPANLSVSVAVEGWEHDRRGRVGELATRLALRTELDASAAAAAADGWGDDRLVRFERDGARGYAWALRWDDRANASAFEAAIGRFAVQRGDHAEDWGAGDETVVRTRRTGPRTTVVLLGSPAFVSAVAVDGAPAVTVSAT